METTSDKHFMNKIEVLENAEKAFADHQFQIYYQPQYNYLNRRIVGTEALVRWIHPQFGIQPPGEFIPVFEDSGLITKLDLYVMEEACRFLRECRESGVPYVPVSFNVSRHDVYACDFVERMERIRKSYGIPVTDLRVEITESAVIGSSDFLIRFVSRLQSLGYTVEMDDFGSGYSSLNVLKDIEVDIIKLDKSFLNNMEKQEKHRKNDVIVIKNIVNMVNDLDMEVIAEGVETQKQAEFLRGINCCMAQGFLFDRPLPHDEYEKRLSGDHVYHISETE